MKLEQDQEVWIKAKVVSATPHRVKVGVGEIYAVVCEEHYNRSSPQTVFVSEHDIVYPPSASSQSKMLLDDKEEGAMYPADVVDRLKIVEDKIRNAEQRAPNMRERVSDLEEKVEKLERSGMWGPGHTIYHGNLKRQMAQIERDIETHNEVITRDRHTFAKHIGILEATHEEPTIGERFHACNCPHRHEQRNCPDIMWELAAAYCAIQPRLRTGAEVISSMKDK